MLRKELDEKLRNLVLLAFRALENVNNDSPLDLVDETSQALKDEMKSIEDWVMSEVEKK
jgi:hypothetical protein